MHGINFDEETDQGDLNLYNKENLPAYYWPLPYIGL